MSKSPSLANVPHYTFVGSRSLDLSLYTGIILRELLELPTPSVVLLRTGAITDPNPFEAFVYSLCGTLKIRAEFRAGSLGDGRSGVFLRDIQLAEESDACVAFFPDTTMSGGTGHVVDKFIDVNKPVKAIMVHPDTGVAEVFGSHDPIPEGV